MSSRERVLSDIRTAIGSADFALALELCETQDSNDPEVMFLLGSALLAARRFVEAADYLSRSLDMLERADAPVRLVSDCRNNLGIALTETRDFERAGEVLGRAWIARNRILGDEHMDSAQTLHNIAYLRLQEGKLEIAERACRQALDTKQRNLSAAPAKVASTLHLLASIQLARLHLSDAWATIESALATFDLTSNMAHPLAAALLELRAEIQLRFGDLRGARETRRRQLDCDRIAYGDEHSVVNSTIESIFDIDRRIAEIGIADDHRLEDDS